MEGMGRDKMPKKMMGMMGTTPSNSNPSLSSAAASATDRLTRPGMASRKPMGAMPWGPQGQGILKAMGMMR